MGGFFFVFRWTQICLGKTHAPISSRGPGAYSPRKFCNNGDKSCNFMHSGSRKRSRVIAVWSAHKSYAESARKIIWLSRPLKARRCSSGP